MNLAKLTDKQRKRIIAEYIEGGTSYRKLAAKYGVTDHTIAQIVKSDRQFSQKIAQKKEENAKSVLAHMELKTKDVCRIIDTYLPALLNEEKIEMSSLPQLATTLGIVLDKFAFTLTEKTGQAVQMGIEDDPITKALKEEFAKDGTISKAKTNS